MGPEDGGEGPDEDDVEGYPSPGWCFTDLCVPVVGPTYSVKVVIRGTGRGSRTRVFLESSTLTPLSLLIGFQKGFTYIYTHT